MRNATSRYFALFCLLLFSHSASGLDIDIPAPLVKKLDSLRQADKLADWIYARVDFAYEHPKETLPFLSSTGKAAWRKPSSAAEKEAWLILMSNLGYNQLYSGDILASIGSYEKAYQYSVLNRLNIDITDYVLKPWANNYTRLGDYEKALFIQQKILEFALKERSDELAASACNNMAISYRSVGDFEQAEKTVRLGLQKCLPDAEVAILLNNTLADIYKDSGQLEMAARVIAENISRQLRRKPDFDTAYWLLSSYTTAGDIALENGRYMEARKYYLLSLGINERFYQGNRLREKSYLITQMGRIKLAEKKPVEALKYFDRNLNTFGLFRTDGSINRNKLFGDNRIIEVFYERAMAYLALHKEEDALENIQLSLWCADKIRFELADVKTKQRFQAETKQKTEQAIEIAFGLLEKTGKSRYGLLIADLAEQSKARTLLDEIRRNQQQMTLLSKDTLFTARQALEKVIAYREKELLQHPKDGKSIEAKNAALKFRLESIETLLREKYPARVNALSAREPLEHVLNQLPRDCQLLEYFAGLRNIYGVLIRDRRVVHVQRIANAKAVRKQIADFTQTYFHHGPDAMMNDPKRFYKASNGVYNLLLGGFKFKEKAPLCVVPDEEIGYVSFDGLITDSTYRSSISKWPFFTRKVSLSYAFSLQTLAGQSHSKTKKKEFTGLFITHQGTDKQYLPAVEKEFESIKKVVSGRFLTDKSATVPHFFEAFDQSAVLHVGTHAYLSGKQQEPTLALDDDQVFLFELSARKNAPALVVLSACQTADGLMASGEGIISLSRGFAAIGTQGTIAGLWNVSDEAASVITSDCYRLLLEGSKISTALHLAKSNWLAGPHNSELEYLPYYWDALIYMGYDQKIALEPASVKGYGMLIFAAALMAAVLVIWLALKPKRPKAGYSKR